MAPGMQISGIRSTLQVWCVGKTIGNLRDKQQTEELFERHHPTHVIHLAAMVGGLFANMSRKVDFFRENILINDNVMECCRKYNVSIRLRSQHVLTNHCVALGPEARVVSFHLYIPR